MCSQWMPSSKNASPPAIVSSLRQSSAVLSLLAIVEKALALYGAPIYVRHEVVHNRSVVEGLKAKGAVFIEDLADVPIGSTVIFSAHGVSKTVRLDAKARRLRIFDATCPLVTKVHVEVARTRASGREIIMIGHRGHPEVEGTMGQVQGGMHLVETEGDVARLRVNDPDNLAFVTQTTLSVDDTRDIIEAFVRHNLAFLDGMVVLDHRSGDETPGILRRLKVEKILYQPEAAGNFDL